MKKVKSINEMIQDTLIEPKEELGEDAKLQKIADLIKGKNLVDIRKDLEKMFNKKDIDWAMEPLPMFMIKDGSKKIAILNKKYVEKPDVVVGEFAIGYMG